MVKIIILKLETKESIKLAPFVDELQKYLDSKNSDIEVIGAELLNKKSEKKESE